MLPYLLLREEGAPTVAERTLTCRICTYDRVYSPDPRRRERVRPGAFKGPLARPGGVLRYRHVGERPGETDDLSNVYGLVTALREEGTAVLADVEVFDGPEGDKILRLAESGAITGVSMAAVIAESTRGRDGVEDIRRVSALNGVSLTPAPAYDDAMVLREQRQQADRVARIKAAQAELAETRRMLAGL